MVTVWVLGRRRTDLDTDPFPDPDALELVLDYFPFLFGLSNLFVCLLSLCSPFQLISFFACRRRSAWLK